MKRPKEPLNKSWHVCHDLFRGSLKRLEFSGFFPRLFCIGLDRQGMNSVFHTTAKRGVHQFMLLYHRKIRKLVADHARHEMRPIAIDMGFTSRDTGFDHVLDVIRIHIDRDFIDEFAKLNRVVELNLDPKAPGSPSVLSTPPAHTITANTADFY